MVLVIHCGNIEILIAFFILCKQTLFSSLAIIRRIYVCSFLYFPNFLYLFDTKISLVCVCLYGCGVKSSTNRVCYMMKSVVIGTFVSFEEDYVVLVKGSYLVWA
jgi:hypothetical protein